MQIFMLFLLFYANIQYTKDGSYIPNKVRYLSGKNKSISSYKSPNLKYNQISIE